MRRRPCFSTSPVYAEKRPAASCGAFQLQLTSYICSGAPTPISVRVLASTNLVAFTRRSRALVRFCIGRFGTDDSAVAIEGMERGGQLLCIVGQVVRSQVLGSQGHDLWQFQHLAYERQFRRMGQQRDVCSLVAVALLSGITQDAGDPGVPVLDIEDGVLVRLLAGQDQIEFHLAVGGATQENESAPHRGRYHRAVRSGPPMFRPAWRGAPARHSPIA